MAECQLPKLNTRVRFPSPAPARRKRRIACDEFFHFIPKLIAYSLCCSSLQNRTRFAELRFCEPPSAAFSGQKRRHPPAFLLLLSKPQLNIAVAVWFLVQTCSRCILLSTHSKRKCDLFRQVAFSFGFRSRWSHYPPVFE